MPKGCLTYLLLLQHKQDKLNYDKIILEVDGVKKIEGQQKQHGLNKVTLRVHVPDVPHSHYLDKDM